MSFATPLISKIIQHEKTREPTIGSSVGTSLGSRKSRKSLSKKTRELSVNNKPRDDSGNVKPSTPQPFVDITSIGLRRGNRQKKRSQMLEHPSDVKKSSKTVYGMLLVESYNTLIHSYNNFLELNFDGTQNSISPLAQIYLSGKVDNEVYNFNEMLKQPDRVQFEAAMYKEVKSMFDNDIWTKVTRTSMLRFYEKELKAGKDITRKQLVMIWTLKRKRHPDGTLDKYKARLCVHGGQEQHGIHFWDTFAPVVSWMSVRTLLVLSKIHQMHTKSIDFVQAYPQADIMVTIYLHTPQGIDLGGNNKDVVLKLKKNLYGLKDAGLTWWEMISKGLLDLGFEQTDTDQCVFKKENVIILIYIDDCIILSRTKEDLDKTLQDIKKDFKITDEGNIETYLGIQIDHEL